MWGLYHKFRAMSARRRRARPSREERGQLLELGEVRLQLRELGALPVHDGGRRVVHELWVGELGLGGLYEAARLLQLGIGEVRHYTPADDVALSQEIIENQDLLGQRQYLQLSMIASQNTKDIIDIRKDLDNVENQMAEVVSSLGDVVTHSELATVIAAVLMLLEDLPACIDIVAEGAGVGVGPAVGVGVGPAVGVGVGPAVGVGVGPAVGVGSVPS